MYFVWVPYGCRAGASLSIHQQKEQIEMNRKTITGHIAKLAMHILLTSICLLVGSATSHAQNVVYELVTNVSQLVRGGRYIIVDVTGKRAMGYQKDNNRHAVNIEGKLSGNLISGIEIASSSNDHDKVYEFTLNNAGEKWGFYDRVNQGFLYPSNNKDEKYNYMGIKESGISTIPTNAQATVKFVLNGDKVNALITFPANGSNKLRLMIGRDRELPTVFSCYDKSETYSGVVLYRKRIGQLSISQYGYTTYVSRTYNYELPQGCLGFAVTCEGDELKLTEKYKPGSVVPAYTPLLIQGTEGVYPIYDTSRNPQELQAGENILHADYDENGNVTYGVAVKDNYFYYKLSTKNSANLGFYWGSQDGGPFKMKSRDRAYLVLPRERSEVKGLVLDEATVETSVVLPNQVCHQDDRVYNLQGCPCDTPLKPGIYIQGGRKIFVGK